MAFEPSLSTEPTGLVIGRFQPPHQGHLWIVEEAVARVGRACIGIRGMPKDEKNPYSQWEVHMMWLKLLESAGIADRVTFAYLPNVTHVFYGRDVGYSIEKLEAPSEVQAISATKIRAQMNAGEKS